MPFTSLCEKLIQAYLVFLILGQRNNLTEEEAHRYMQKRSMDNGTGLTETAQMILSLLT